MNLVLIEAEYSGNITVSKLAIFALKFSCGSLDVWVLLYGLFLFANELELKKST